MAVPAVESAIQTDASLTQSSTESSCLTNEEVESEWTRLCYRVLLNLTILLQIYTFGGFDRQVSSLISLA